MACMWKSAPAQCIALLGRHSKRNLSQYAVSGATSSGLILKKSLAPPTNKQQTKPSAGDRRTAAERETQCKRWWPDVARASSKKGQPLSRVATMASDNADNVIKE